MRSENAFG